MKGAERFTAEDPEEAEEAGLAEKWGQKNVFLSYLSAPMFLPEGYAYYIPYLLAPE